MSELRDQSEILEATAGTEIEHFPHERALDGACERIREQVSGGDGFERATEKLAAELHGELLERLDLAKEISGGVRELVELARPLLGDTADKFVEGLDAFDAMIQRGESWLRANPEKVEAGVRLLVLAALAAYEPSFASALLREDTNRLLDPLRVLLEGAPE